MIIILMALVWGLPSAIIANSKGRSFVAWYFYGMMLPVAAIPHACVIRDEREPAPMPVMVRQPVPAPVTRAAEPARGQCPDCQELIVATARVCRFCGWRKPEDETAPLTAPGGERRGGYTAWGEQWRETPPVDAIRWKGPAHGTVEERMAHFDRREGHYAPSVDPATAERRALQDQISRAKKPDPHS